MQIKIFLPQGLPSKQHRQRGQARLISRPTANVHLTTSAYNAPPQETPRHYSLFSVVLCRRESLRNNFLRFLLNSPQVIFAEETLRVEFIHLLGA